LLYMVRSASRVPWGMEKEVARDLGDRQLAKTKELKEKGVLLHHWRAAAQHLSYAVYDVASNAELHDVLLSLPLYPYSTAQVVPLATPPSS
jgi:muconolactone D-isomerase